MASSDKISVCEPVHALSTGSPIMFVLQFSGGWWCNRRPESQCPLTSIQSGSTGRFCHDLSMGREMRQSAVTRLTGGLPPPLSSSSAPFGSQEAAMLQEHFLIGRITGLRIFKVPEFGTRASFKLEGPEQGSVTCAVAGDVARDFVTDYREGDIVAVTGTAEPRPSTAS